MHVRSSASGIHVLAPAKLNLFLEVRGKRDDGFHEIETLMVPIGWHDSLDFHSRPEPAIVLDCRQAGSDCSREAGIAESRSSGDSQNLPRGHDNIIWRAVSLLRERAQVASGAVIRLIKRIPLAAGLAGGSSDAAAALVAANLGWGLHWPRHQLASIAAELGSDVPFFLGQGAALCQGRGERMEPVAGLGRLHFVVVKPPAGLSTAEVYQRWSAMHPRTGWPGADPASRPAGPSAQELIRALRRGELGLAGRLLYNALECAARELSPWIDRLQAEFARLGFLGHQMSGSGTSYFGLCRNARHARHAAAGLRQRGIGRAFAVQGSC